MSKNKSQNNTGNNVGTSQTRANISVSPTPSGEKTTHKDD